MKPIHDVQHIKSENCIMQKVIADLRAKFDAKLDKVEFRLYRNFQYVTVYYGEQQRARKIAI